MSKPISPDDVQLTIPDWIIEAVNDLIKENWDGRRSVVVQSAILVKVSSRMDEKEVLARHFLDIESLYREAGWVVEYHKPDYNASNTYPPYFEFRKK